MAISANACWELRQDGVDTNGGGFVTGASGVDYSQTASKRTATGSNDSTTDAVANGTTTLTSASANFTADIVGNIIYLEGGTGTLAASWYQVTARGSSTSITLDRTVATGTGITMNIGGALASLGAVSLLITASGMRVYVKTGASPYLVTSASEVAGGVWNTTADNIVIEGYESSRGDLSDNRPVFKASGISTFVFITITGNRNLIVNIDFDGDSLTSGRGMALGSISQTVFRCKGVNFTNTFITGTSVATCIFCEAEGCTTQPALAFHNYFYCEAHDNTVAGFSHTTTARLVRCLSYNNSGATSDGFLFTGDQSLLHCVAYNNGRAGFRTTAASTYQTLANCIAEDNAGWGYESTSTAMLLLLNCAAYSNGSGEFSVGTNGRQIGSITGSGSFFTSAAGADFSLNNTGGAGAALREVGYPTTFPAGTTDNFLDIGAAQHEDGAGASTVTTAHTFFG